MSITDSIQGIDISSSLLSESLVGLVSCGTASGAGGRSSRADGGGGSGGGGGCFHGEYLVVNDPGAGGWKTDVAPV